MKANARRIAAEALCAFFRGNSDSENMIKSRLRDTDLSERDAALALQLYRGVLQHLYQLDYAIEQVATLPLRKMQPQVRVLIRLGAYQLYFLDRIPVSAVVNESVELAAGLNNRRASGFVNGILRTLSKNRSLPTFQSSNWEETISHHTSHPVWLIRRLEELVGREETVSFADWNNSISPLTIHTNLLKNTSEELICTLDMESSCYSPHNNIPDCFLLKHTGNLMSRESFCQGKFYVQDAAAHLAALACNPQPGDSVLDLCAAPGGKSICCAVAMRNKGSILACDIQEKKLPLISENALRLGLSCIETMQLDATSFNPKLKENFDLVIADVPCSGFGVIRRKPEIRYKDPASLQSFPSISREILKNAAHYVKMNKNIVFSTCTIFPEENENVVKRFLSENPSFHLEPFVLPGIGFVSSGMITLWPQRHQTDGFFIAKLRRGL